MRDSFSYLGVDDDAIKISSKKIADNEVELTMTMNFKDFAKELFTEEELKELDNFTFDKVKDKIIESMEDDNITCEIPN